MPPDLSSTIVVGISASALFDLREADEIFQRDGIQAYRDHMVGLEDEPLEPGTGFALVRALLNLNAHAPAGGGPLAEVMVMSRNSAETGVRIMNAVRGCGLAISRYAFTGGEPLAGYARAYGVDLFLSTTETDVQAVVDGGADCAAALLYPPPSGYEPPTDQVRFAFDADAVLFSQEAEVVYREEGLAAYHASEDAAKHVPLPGGPFASFLRKLARLKEALPERMEYSPVRIAVVTARNAPAETRVITTLRAWDVYADEAFFLGGLPKAQVLAEFRPHIFFDDQDLHVLPASSVVPAGRVPYKAGTPLNPEDKGEDGAEEAGGAIPLTRSPADAPPPAEEAG
jgi:5'-nucleotidase